jgi:predicted  nucleic acid-binding Zn-ribbon protein
MSSEKTATRIATPLVPVSWGELIDKITILEIKSARLTSAAALQNVRKELAQLNEKTLPLGDMSQEVAPLKADLTRVNEALWEIEDKIRDKEAAKAFDAEFIELARSVYVTNDKRAALKRQINQLLASELVEEKGYAAY